MLLIVLIVLLVAALGGGGIFASRGNGSPLVWSPAGVILLLIVVLWATGNLR